LIIYQRELGEMQNATADWDHSVGSFVWTPDSNEIFVTAEDHGNAPIYALSTKPRKPVLVWPLGHSDDLIFSRDGKTLFSANVSISAPNEIWRLDSNTLDHAAKPEPIRVTHMNDALLSQIDMQPMESFTFKG